RAPHRRERGRRDREEREGYRREGPGGRARGVPADDALRARRDPPEPRRRVPLRALEPGADGRRRPPRGRDPPRAPGDQADLPRGGGSAGQSANRRGVPGEPATCWFRPVHYCCAILKSAIAASWSHAIASLPPLSVTSRKPIVSSSTECAS